MFAVIQSTICLKNLYAALIRPQVESGGGREANKKRLRFFLSHQCHLGEAREWTPTTQRATYETLLAQTGLSVKAKPGCHKRLGLLIVLNHALVHCSYMLITIHECSFERRAKKRKVKGETADKQENSLKHT